MIILPYYCVIGGWVVKYFAAFLSGQGNAAAGETYFANFTAQTAQPIVWFCVYAIATAVVVLLGVEKGVMTLGVGVGVLLLLFVLSTLRDRKKEKRHNG